MNFVNSIEIQCPLQGLLLMKCIEIWHFSKENVSHAACQLLYHKKLASEELKEQ